MKGFTTMYDYRGKVAGMAISVLGFAALVLERLHPFTIISGWNAEQHYGLFEWIALCGLFLIMFSKEKVDDERTKLVRLKALQISFMLTISPILAFGLTGALSAHPEELALGGRELYLFPALGIIVYLLIFHVGIYFDDVWEYEDKGLFANLKSIPANKWGLLAYFGICAVAMLLLTLL